MVDLEHLHAASPRRLPRRHLQLLTFLGLIIILGLSVHLLSGYTPSLNLSQTTISLDLPPSRPTRPTKPKYKKVPSSTRLVPLEAHIMSKCPDAKDCMHSLILPAMQRIESLVDFKLSFIGTYVLYLLIPSSFQVPHPGVIRTASESNDDVTCLHGPSECLGIMLLLCAAALYPTPKTYLGFTMCMLRDYKEIPDRSLVEDCSLEHGMDFGSLNGCVSSDDGFGLGLLRDSVRHSAEDGVKTSCTVRVAGKTWCVRDGGKWKDCDGGSGVDALVGEVQRLASVG